MKAHRHRSPGVSPSTARTGSREAAPGPHPRVLATSRPTLGRFALLLKGRDFHPHLGAEQAGEEFTLIPKQCVQAAPQLGSGRSCVDGAAHLPHILGAALGTLPP